MVFLNQLTAVAVLGLATVATAQNSSSTSTSSPLPIVDLGYQRHQATYNATGKYYNFSNIRYAAPPLGDLRFAAPQAPAVNRTHVNDGQDSRICPQAAGAWSATSAQFLTAYFEGQTQFNSSSFASPSNNSSTTTTVDPRTNEDCLFLDVVVPEDIFLSDTQHPVLVWIYGGGYTAGSKDGSGSPAGLISRSESNDSSGIIYVALNYRLGAFGWLSGPTFQENGTANAGLHDQRFALEWVQNNIHLFGGNPKNVTVIGESAGGGSIMHQITAYGGARGPAPFQAAIPQSPGFLPVISSSVLESQFQTFLGLLNVSSLAEARRLPTSVLQLANARQVGASSYGQFTYGPTVDGDFVPALPGQLLLHGQYDKNITLMTGHNANEGVLFTSPFIKNDTDLRAFLTSAFPSLTSLPTTLNYILETLYPPIFDGSQAQNYTSQIARTAAIVSEALFTCNAFYLQEAYGNASYAYLFGVPPSYHGQDVPYTFYNGNGSATTGVAAPATALAMQKYITNFAEFGNPNGVGAGNNGTLPSFDVYGENATVQVLGARGITQMRDPAANLRCVWWQKGLWF